MSYCRKNPICTQPDGHAGYCFRAPIFGDNCDPSLYQPKETPMTARERAERLQKRLSNDPDAVDFDAIAQCGYLTGTAINIMEEEFKLAEAPTPLAVGPDETGRTLNAAFRFGDLREVVIVNPDTSAWATILDPSPGAVLCTLVNLDTP
jgi:hypothetical protein